MRNEPSRALIAYAALADRLTKGGDVVQALMSFFRPIANEFSGELFDVDKFCGRVLHLYGLSVPKLAALGWCERLSQENLLEVHTRNGSTVLYRWKGISSMEGDENLETFQLKVENLLEQFRNKCAVDMPSELISIVKDRLETEFFDRLLRLDSMRLLLRKEGAFGVKSSSKTLGLKPTVSPIDERVSLQLDFVVADFILTLRDNSEADFNFISSILFANMAAEAISTFREPPAGGALLGMRVYLDTPLILDMFRVNSGFENYADELWALLKKSGAQIKAFDHTVQETESVISARLAAIRSGVPISTYSLKSGLRVESLSLLEGRVAQNLEERGVVIERDPETSLLKISQRALGTVQADLDKKMGGWKREAKHFDEKTVFSVIALRSQMNVETTFAKAGALLLTRNTPLVAIANTAWRTWLNEATNESKTRIARTAPIAISDKQFAGLVWLVGGQEQAAPLSRARMVAHCAAAIRPRADVIAKACNLVIEAHGKEEGEKFAALMTNGRAEQAVMRASLGDPESVTKDRLPEIVEHAMLAAGELAAQAERAKADAEKATILQQHEHDLTEKRRELELLERQSDMEKAQVALELDNERRTVAGLKMREMAREIRVLSDKRTAFEAAFSHGTRIYKQTRFLVILIYGGVFLLLGLLLTEHPLVTSFVSLVLTIVSFWFLPEVLFKPMCQWIAQHYFLRNLQFSLGSSVEHSKPDFSEKLLPFLEHLDAEILRLEKDLLIIRQAA